MRALGFDVRKADVLKILADLDKDQTSTVDYSEFLEISALPPCVCVRASAAVVVGGGTVRDAVSPVVAEKIAERDPMEEVAKAFRLFDDDEDGAYQYG